MSSNNGRVLVVDDDRITRTLLAANLTKQGYAAVTTGNGREALAFLREESFDVVLLDLLMPDMDGYQVLGEMKQDKVLRHIPVIVISQLDRMDSAIRCIELGATDYLAKPFNRVLLEARINASLAHKRMRDMEQECMTKIQKAHDDLDQRVRERTKQLVEANIRLQKQIEERKQAEEAREAAERRLEEQRLLSLRSDRLRALGEMAAGIAHELNQPLVGVRGMAEHILIAMKRGWNMDEEKVRDKLSLIIEQADRMAHIIEHVRLFSREAGKPEVQPVNVNDVASSAIGLLGEQLRSRGIQLECGLGEALPPVLANAFSLEEVILNLLVNARDALEERKDTCPGADCAGISLQTFVNDESPKQRRVEIEVADRGIGIPEELLPRVFDAFFTTKGPDKGTGLGLPISRSIVQQYGGEIHIESSPASGTKVAVSLPALESGTED